PYVLNQRIYNSSETDYNDRSQHQVPRPHKDKMHFSAIFPVITLVLGTTNAVAIDESLVEPRVPSCPSGIQLIQISGFGKNGNGVFTGVGIPTICQNFPRNIRTFDPNNGESLNGFQCTIFEKKDCSEDGNTFVLDSPNRFSKVRTPKWRSWKCVCKTC
ncbi:hypothetical protein EDB80DRAFT_815727, partial [Ilyonectria destructans]